MGVFGADASVVARYITEQPVFDLLKGTLPNDRGTLLANSGNESRYAIVSN